MPLLASRANARPCASQGNGARPGAVVPGLGIVAILTANMGHGLEHGLIGVAGGRGRHSRWSARADAS
jgi:hypothetical protein